MNSMARKTLGLAAMTLVMGLAQAQSSTAPAPPGPMSNKEQVSYASGVSAVRNFLKNDVPLDLDKLIQGIRDAAAGKELAMTDKEIRLAMNSLQVDLRRNMAATQRELTDKNRKHGNEFMAAYRAKPGVNVLSNGVAYTVIKAGTGPKPSELDSVGVRYRGTLTTGEEFDATQDGKTSTLRINQVIMGWREALKHMPVGSKWELVIPPQLAYGERGVGSVIGPNETLVFEVELVEIKK